ncbi:hypothetical protein HMPREF3195_00361 [Peptostreptococcus anaerobius]|uniref:Uncharacterized protein n=1 Tax=Peptostreptococcus anaerobius TaxID=1261 RepID=A0A135YXQ6_9FIRM|nr:hypothetical protein HMPREF3195_00361 [Peptostreptococcus anaerobius]
MTRRIFYVSILYLVYVNAIMDLLILLVGQKINVDRINHNLVIKAINVIYYLLFNFNHID